MSITYGIILSTLLASQFGSGIHTLETNDAEVSLERPITFIPAKLFSFNQSEKRSLAACIAQPDSWPEPTANFTGKAYHPETEEEYNFDDQAVIANSAPLLNVMALSQGPLYPNENYVWHCFDNKPRVHRPDDKGQVTFKVQPQQKGVPVYTSLYKTPISFFEVPAYHISSHLIKPDDYQGIFLKPEVLPQVDTDKLTKDIPSKNLRHLKIDDKAYFYSTSNKLIISDLTSEVSQVDIPFLDQLVTINSKFIALKDHNVKINEDDEETVINTFVRSTSDINNFPDATNAGFDIEKIQFDAGTNTYLASEQGVHNHYYTSTDLISWQKQDLVENLQAINLDDQGNGLLAYTNQIQNLTIKVSDGLWQEIDVLPATNLSYSINSATELNGKFFILLSGIADQENNISKTIYLGHSENLTDWQWQLLDTETYNIKSNMDLAAYQDGKVMLLAKEVPNKTVIFTEDNGASWKSGAQIAPSSTSLATFGTVMHYEKPSFHQGQYYGRATLVASHSTIPHAGDIATYYYQTSDFENYKIWSASPNGQYVFMPDQVWFNDYKDNIEWNIYKLMHTDDITITDDTETDGQTEPEDNSGQTANTPESGEADNNSGGGSLFYLLAAFALLVRSRKTA